MAEAASWTQGDVSEFDVSLSEADRLDSLNWWWLFASKGREDWESKTYHLGQERMQVERTSQLLLFMKAGWAWDHRLYSPGQNSQEVKQRVLIVHWMILLNKICCCSVAKLSPTLYEPLDCSTTGVPVLQCLPELVQIHVSWVGDTNHLILCCSLLLLPSVFPSIRLFSTESALCLS